jgi:hypothetical protein
MMMRTTGKKMTMDDKMKKVGRNMARAHMQQEKAGNVAAMRKPFAGGGKVEAKSMATALMNETTARGGGAATRGKKFRGVF